MGMVSITLDPGVCRKLGRILAEGVTDHLGRMLLIGFAVLFCLSAILDRCAPTDTTDAGWAARSGVSLRTDYGTGCQYLESSHGFLTPRLDFAGHPICGAAR